MDPSAEMQKEAREKRRNLPVQETAEEFFLDLKISQCFEYSAHLILSIPMISTMKYFVLFDPVVPATKSAQNSHRLVLQMHIIYIREQLQVKPRTKLFCENMRTRHFSTCEFYEIRLKGYFTLIQL